MRARLAFHFVRINHTFFVLSDWTPLFWASVNGNDELCGLLVTFKADVNAKDKMYDTLFFPLGYGYPPNGQHSVIRHRTPLRYSSGMGHIEVCRRLVDCKADVRAKDSECSTHSPHLYSKFVSLYSFALLTNFSSFFLQWGHRIALVL
jgi:hypothetical protein